MKPTIRRVDASPLKILTTLEQAHKALDGGDVAGGRALVRQCVERLETAKAQQDVALDVCAQTPEARAPRETPPQHPGEER
jgi:hypothetical protein